MFARQKVSSEFRQVLHPSSITVLLRLLSIAQRYCKGRTAASTWEVTRSRSVAIARQHESRSVKRGFEPKCRSRAKLHFRNRHFFWPRRCTCPHRRGKSAVRYLFLQKYRTKQVDTESVRRRPADGMEEYRVKNNNFVWFLIILPWPRYSFRYAFIVLVMMIEYCEFVLELGKALSCFHEWISTLVHNDLDTSKNYNI